MRTNACSEPPILPTSCDRSCETVLTFRVRPDILNLNRLLAMSFSASFAYEYANTSDVYQMKSEHER